MSGVKEHFLTAR